VTPTPKKHSYSRKNKSLGLLCENFIQTYNTSHVAVSIDDAAMALGVERRRIYDIINIFESLDIVSRKCKNTYNWLGIADLNKMFGKLQQDAFSEFPQDAVDHGLLFLSPEEMPDRVPPQKKSLGRLSQQFLQLFLVGHPVMALTDASDKILGASSFEELAALANKEEEEGPKTARELQQAATRGLKTKIRRLYDIANVFVALGIIKKLEQSDRKCKPVRFSIFVRARSLSFIIRALLLIRSIILVSFAVFSVGVSQIGERNSRRPRVCPNFSPSPSPLYTFNFGNAGACKGCTQTYWHTRGGACNGCNQAFRNARVA
jgi:transcription factor E2F7/8